MAFIAGISSISGMPFAAIVSSSAFSAAFSAAIAASLAAASAFVIFCVDHEPVRM